MVSEAAIGTVRQAAEGKTFAVCPVRKTCARGTCGERTETVRAVFVWKQSIRGSR